MNNTDVCMSGKATHKNSKPPTKPNKKKLYQTHEHKTNIRDIKPFPEELQPEQGTMKPQWNGWAHHMYLVAY